MVNKKIKNFFIDNKKILMRLLKFIFAAAILFFLIDYLSINKIIFMLSKADLKIVSLSFLLILLNIFLQFKRWELLCTEVLKEKHKYTILKSVFYGISSGLITPFRIGEFFGRAFTFKGENFHKAVSLSILDRFLSLFVTLVLGGIAFIFFSKKYFNIAEFTLFITVISFILILVLLITITYFGLIKPKKIKFLQKIINYFSIIKNVKLNILTRLVLFSVLFFITYVAQFALLISAFAGIENIMVYFLIGVLVFFTNTIIPPFTFGELGIRESAAIFFSKVYGVQAVVGFNSSIILFLFNLLIPSIIGLIIYIKDEK
ncbi:MAG: lysylphosphatidylglycerol synthase transmembrane domain-containing protein [bacterium]